MKNKHLEAIAITLSVGTFIGGVILGISFLIKHNPFILLSIIIITMLYFLYRAVYAKIK